MAETELLALRGRNRKVFDLGDGHRRMEVGNHAHHQKDGQWVETDRNWTDLTDRFGTGEYPYTVALQKSSRTLSITYDGESITLQPQNTQSGAKVVVTRLGEKVTLAGLWKGITAEFQLTPEGLKATYTRTAAQFVNPTYNIVGHTEWLGAPYYENPNAIGIADRTIYPPVTLDAGVWTLDMSAVPIGVPVDPTITPQSESGGNRSPEYYSTGGTVSWSTMHAATSGTSTVSTASIPASAGYYYADRWIDRAFFPFDTSGIPDTATIDSASLYLRAVTRSSTSGQQYATLALVESTASATNVGVADYDNVGSTELATTHPSITNANTDVTLTLNASGLAVISKTGYTKLAIRNYTFDFLNSAPPDGDYATVTLASVRHATTAYRPVLTVNYTEGAADAGYMTTNKGFWG